MSQIALLRKEKRTPNNLMRAEELREKKSPYIKKKNRPITGLEYDIIRKKDSEENSDAIWRADVKKIRYERRLAAKAHEFLYIIMHERRKKDCVVLGEMITQKIIWEYLRARFMVIEINSGRNNLISVGKKTYISRTPLIFNRILPTGKFINMHFVVCERCWRILDNAHFSGTLTLRRIKFSIDTCALSANKNMLDEEMLASAILFRYAYSPGEFLGNF
jgi:hypothetical protein